MVVVCEVSLINYLASVYLRYVEASAYRDYLMHFIVLRD